jgi:hypothetical protein
MDFETFAKKLDAARSVKITAEGIEFEVVLPTEYDISESAHDARSVSGFPNPARAMRSLLMRSIKGWKGAKESHILPDAGEEALDFSPLMLAALLDARQDIVASVTGDVTKLRAERLEARAESEKN